MSKSALAIITAVLSVIAIEPAFAQVATQGDIDILNRQIMDLDYRLRALEGERNQKRQAEREEEQRRQQDQEWAAYREERRNCDAYRRRMAGARPLDPNRAGAAEMRMLDKLDESSCKGAEKFEADIKARVRALEQRK